ncbi:hypothetical protein V2I01_39385 [Micromonospora sp. BRA006-A]|nr:hypothetical protein [Micromonospora sp. BRA006-A]
MGVTGYEVYANGTLRTTVSGSTLTYATASRTARQSRTTSGVATPPERVGEQQHRHPHRQRHRQRQPGGRQARHRVVDGARVRRRQRCRRRRHHVLGGRARRVPEHALTVALGANASISAVVVKLNPTRRGARAPRRSRCSAGSSPRPGSPAWPARDVLLQPGQRQHGDRPVSATAADVRLQFTANSGSSNGQVAELQVIGVPAPNPDSPSRLSPRRRPRRWRPTR